MEASKHAVKAILVTLGAAFVLLSVIEWKKLADQIPSDDGTYGFQPAPGDSDYDLVCRAAGIVTKDPTTGNPVYPAGTAPLSVCQKVTGNNNVPWAQGIKAFVYSWIGIGLLVAAFIKPKGAGVAGGYW